jgi:hypothetical protein
MHVDQAGDIHGGGLAGIWRAKNGGFLGGKALIRNGHQTTSVRDVTQSCC